MACAREPANDAKIFSAQAPCHAAMRDISAKTKRRNAANFLCSREGADFDLDM